MTIPQETARELERALRELVGVCRAGANEDEALDRADTVLSAVDKLDTMQTSTALVRQGVDTIVAIALADIEADPKRFKHQDKEIDAALAWLKTVTIEAPKERKKK